MRNRSLIRVLTELRALEASRVGLSLEELARQTAVSDRTVRRDLEALQAAGVPLIDVAADLGLKRRWRVMPAVEQE